MLHIHMRKLNSLSFNITDYEMLQNELDSVTSHVYVIKLDLICEKKLLLLLATSVRNKYLVKWP